MNKEDEQQKYKVIEPESKKTKMKKQAFDDCQTIFIKNSPKNNNKSTKKTNFAKIS